MKRIYITILTLLLICKNVYALSFFSPSLDCENNLIKYINETESSLDIAIYSFTNKNIFSVIIDAKNRGIKIRVLADRLQSANKYSMIKDLKSARVDVRFNKKNRVQHNKYAIFDNKKVVNGSYNWSYNANKDNYENCHFFDNNDDVQAYISNFTEIWSEN